LEISFQDRSIRTLCEDPDAASIRFGQAVAKDLMSRLADIDATDFIEDLVVGNPGELKEDNLYNYKVELGEGYRLIFCCNHVKNIPLTENGSIDWKRVTRIKILKIEKI
jgi:plasmid maintenance system killer protein